MHRAARIDMSKTILLTGADGFTGRHLTRAAAARGYRVLALKSDLLNPDALIEPLLFWQDVALADGQPRDAGQPLTIQGLFPPGDYHISLESRKPSDAEYRLSLERLPRFGCPADCEPTGVNDLYLVSPLPPDFVLEGVSGEWRDLDAYALPQADAPYGLTIRSDAAPQEVAIGRLAELVPDEPDAVLVERLRSAGCPIIGKTNTSEFGCKFATDNLVFGATLNPWNLKLSPGGSSGGATAQVAAGMGPLAVGNDGGGSIRVPASCCGVYGLKPQFGRIPSWPRHDGWSSLIHEGPIARTVRDAAALLLGADLLHQRRIDPPVIQQVHGQPMP